VSAGRVIFLNGTSSSGKTTLARAIQDSRLPELWLLLGIDTFITATPWQLFGTAEGHDIKPDGSITVGPAFRAAQASWRAGVAAIARAGTNVVLDEVLLRGGEEQAEWRDVLAALDVTWVGVHVDLDVAEAREAARGDRSVGMARHQATVVHTGVTYDVEVDTTSTPTEVLAAQIQIG